MAGMIDKAKGWIKDTAGRMTGKTKMRVEGRTDQATGQTGDVAHDVRQGAKGVKDSPQK